MTSTQITAREYLRVSKDKSGRERSITEQHAENADQAAEHGWELGDPYADVGSASRYATRPRGNFDTLIADLRADRFGADVLILWESSRGSRRVSEWLEVIELCEQRGVKIHVTTHGRTYDPTNGHDRKALIDDATDSEYESWKISRRAKRANGRDAAAGRPHGRVPLGYRREREHVTDPETGKLKVNVRQVIDPETAPIVRELFARIVKGHSLRSIARDFAARGIVKPSGGPYSAAHLRAIATAHAYAGLRVHVPGRQDGNHQPRPDMQVHEADWPAIIDRRTWLRTQEILSAPERRTTRPGRAVHLLSMIAACDVCAGPLAARAGKGGRVDQYTCHRRGCVRIGKAELDELAERAVIAYLSRDDVAETITRRDGDDAELDAAKLAVDEIRAELRDLEQRTARGELSLAFAANVEPGIRERLRLAEARVDELAAPPALAGYITPGRDVARRWRAAPMSARREVARLLLSPAYLGELRVTRSPSPGHRVDAAERVTFGPIDG